MKRAYPYFNGKDPDLDEKKFAREVENIGGRAYIVGGWVRDLIMERTSNDKDYVITGVAEDIFTVKFPEARRVGNSFPVYLMKIDGKSREVAFARQERKTGSGYRGFAVFYDPFVTIEEDLFRRDLTINSMACSLTDDAIIDPFGGAADIRSKIIRATSRHFPEDPVRALRAARQAAQLEFKIEQRTIGLMRDCGAELRREPKERIFMEMEKALAARCPSLFFRSLRKAALLQIAFPLEHCRFLEEAFESAMIIMDRVASKTERPELRFAALLYGAGKSEDSGEAPPYCDNRAKNKLKILEEISGKMVIPRLWKRCAQLVIEKHTLTTYLARPEEIRDLLTALSKHPIGFDGFCIIIEAYYGFLPKYLAQHEKYMEAIREAQKADIPSSLHGAEIGAWRRQLEIEAVAEVTRS